MHRSARVAAMVLLLGVACTASAGPLQPDQARQSATGQSATASGSSAPGPGSRVAIQYEASAKFPEVAATLKRHEVLEELQQFLSPLRLPKELKIVARDCGAQTVPYQSGELVMICYDSINQITDEAAKIYPQDEFSRNLVITGSTIEVVLHETAHAVFDLLQVPVWGREDDAADRLAALLMMQFGEDMEKVTIYGTTTYFKSLAAAEKAWSGSDYANRASPNAQRYFNYLCIAASADPALFGGALKNGTIPPFRAGDCSREYQQVRAAFDLTIMPFVDPEALVKVRATDWLKWANAK